MSEEAHAREEMCRIAKSIYDRGLTHGSTGNISLRLSDGTILITPTGSSMGFLDPARISGLDASFEHISGDKPTKEVPLHAAFYETRSGTGAVVHLHSTYATAWSMMEGVDPEDALPPLTPYCIMQLGKVRLLPVYLPGDPAMGDAVRALRGRHSAVLFANHGPVVADKNILAALYATEELEASARLALLTRGLGPRHLTPEQINGLKRH